MRRTALTALCAVLLSATSSLAFFEPPIKSPQDAACRDEARSRVFSTPDPEGVGMMAIGKRIYHACMAASKGAGRVANAAAR